MHSSEALILSLAVNDSKAASLQVPSRIRSAVDRLKRLTRDTSLTFALDVGRVVVETIYGGDLDAWRSRGRKEYALRSLAADPELPISASALYRALAIYELSQRAAWGVATWKHLGVSHARAVLGLDEDTQGRLLRTAEAECWTVARLEQEVSSYRTVSRARGGRKPIPRYIKSIRQIHQLTKAEALDGLDEALVLEPKIREELLGKLAQARERLAQLERVLPRSRVAEQRGHR